MRIKKFVDSRRTRTLNWINRVRVKKLGLKPLKDIKKGYICQSAECPVANSLPMVNGRLFGNDADNAKLEIEEPQYVMEFILSFDCENYKDLVKKPRTI